MLPSQNWSGQRRWAWWAENTYCLLQWPTQKGRIAYLLIKQGVEEIMHNGAGDKAKE